MATHDAALKSDRVERHPLAVRLTHWLVALSGIALLFSGFGNLPMYHRYNVVKIPGLSWAGDFSIHLTIHYVASIVFVGAVIFHVVYHLRRRELAAVPRKGDVKESVHIIKAMIKGKGEPPHGKFLAEQRLAYLAIALTTVGLILTGLVKVYKNLGNITLHPTLLQVITLTHTLLGMLFMLLLVAHLGAFLIKANWPLLPSMITGYVKRSYAKARHPLWDIDGTGEGEKTPPTPLGTTKEVLRFVPGVLVLTSVVLGVAEDAWWLALAGFVGANLVQSAFSKWCLLERMLLRAGLPDECDQAASTIRFSRPSTTKDIIRLVAGVMILGSVSLALYVSPWGLLIGGFVGANLLQSSFTRWCLLESLLERAGVPGSCQQAAA